MRILLWHVHGSWTTAFVQGEHEYFIPVTPDRGPDGLGRARTWDWPASVHEVPLDRLAEAEPDVVLLQRPHEEELVRRLGRKPLVYLEHDAPWGDVPLTRHPMADRRDVHLVHVTHFNDLFWDAGTTPTTVIEHGIVDPGYRYSGELREAAVAINEPARRGRVTGTDLLPRLNGTVPLRLFGIGAGELGGVEDPPQEELHAELARRRAYLPPIRWTSLGLSLLEAMHLGMPVVALGTTEVAEAVPRSAGFVSTDVAALSRGLNKLMDDPEEARE